MNVNPNAPLAPSISTQAVDPDRPIATSDDMLEKAVSALLRYGTSVAIVGEWPVDGNRRQEILDDIRETLSRMYNQGPGDGYSLTVVANPRKNSLPAAALRVASDLGIKTLAIRNFCNDPEEDGRWDHEIVVTGTTDEHITLMPDCRKEIYGRMTQISDRPSVLLAYGGGFEAMAEAWRDYQPVFFEDKFMHPDDARKFQDEFLKNTYIRRMAFAHRNGYELGNGESDQPWFFDKNNRREDEQFRPDDRHWFVKLTDYLGIKKSAWTDLNMDFYDRRG
ncbi:hypothetical protein [Pandoraea sp. NPDC090278]|uniref:hypothetical protein n=1 Tax=Pandoraea sp. NPDC090278 TaxID=3364391 RepID=UPI00383BD646